MQIEFTLKNNERCLLTADERNYIINQQKVAVDADTGEKIESSMPPRYFASTEQALTRLIDLKLRASDATDLKQLMSDLAAARKAVTSVWNTNFQKV